MDAFTPNGDGINDRWLVNLIACYTKALVEVFNRYGNRVFRSDNYQNDWDGRWEGKPVPDGTYYYVITLELINGKKTYVKGNVTILR
jgi:gliding motility-associated-like protein